MKGGIGKADAQWAICRAWVWGRLVPVLKAGGTEVLIDRERFEAGRAVVGQMDGLQDQAERQLICWSADHATSDACRHEWRRALAKDPRFQSGLILLAQLDGSDLPVELPADLTQPLYIDLREDSKPNPWQLLLRGCAAELGTTRPHGSPPEMTSPMPSGNFDP